MGLFGVLQFLDPKPNKLTTIKIILFLKLFVDNEMVSEIDFLNRENREFLW
jgi:hypothetical protein